MPARRARVPPGAARAAAVCLLLAVAVVGLRGHVPLTLSLPAGLQAARGQPLFNIFLGVEAAGVLVGAVLFAVLLRARAKPSSEDQPEERGTPPVSRWAMLLLLAITLAGLALPFVLLALQSAHRTRQPRPGGGSHPALCPSCTGSTGIPWWLPAAIILALVVALALIIPWRRRAAAAAPAPATAAPAASSPLPAALAAGTRALGDAADPRAAIVGCYAAMERSLAEAGSPPTAADTPAEVLARATGDGLLRSAAAGTLTGLFRRARYSRHAMTEADREAARGALSRLRGELAEAAERGDRA